MKVFVSVFCFFCSVLCFGQLGTLKGTVIDSKVSHEPVLFANIQLKDSKITAETNFHGNFTIANIAPGEYTLVISYPGYDTIEVSTIVEADQITEITESLSPLTLSMGDFDLGDAVARKEKASILRDRP